MNDADILPIHDAARFLDTLGDPPFLFQTFAEPRGAKSGKRLDRIIAGTFGSTHKQLQTLNQSGAAICVMVNEDDGTNMRRAANVVRVRCLFVDLDGAPLEPIHSAPLRPHAIVESSPGRYHAYWRVMDCPLSEFRGAQQHLAATFGGDTSVCDLPRVMRVPGFLHRKNTPYLSRVIECDAFPAYPFTTFAQAFGTGAAPIPTEAGPYAEGNRNSGLFMLACGLRRQGIDHDEAARRIAMVNQSACQPPLSANDVRSTVASAYAGELAGFITLPNALLDSAEYKALSPAARNLVDLAYRRYLPHAADCLVLSFANFRDYFTKSHFYALRKEAIDAGLFIETKPSKQPCKGTKPEPATYRLRYVHSPAGRTIKHTA